MTGHDDAAQAFAEHAGPPSVNTTNRHLGDYVDEVVTKLAATNDPPTLFAHGGGVAELIGDRLEPLDERGLLDAIERRLRVVRLNKGGDAVPVVLAGPALTLALRRLRHHVPPLERLAFAPFLRAEGTVCQLRGYDQKSAMYLVDDIAVDVSDRPTHSEVEESIAVLDDAITDFPFRDAASRAHAYSLMFTAATRHLYHLAPLHAVSGNAAGTGKGLLTEVLLRPVIGDAAAMTSGLSLDAEEQRKSITTLLAQGAPAALWDEAHVLEGRPLAQLLTSRSWHDRLLGVNRALEAPNRLTTVALGNQMRVLGDLRRRCVLVELETNLANPAQRTGFRHADLKTYAEEHRGELLSSVLTVLRAWHVAGRPAGTAVLGSFERWAELVGGVLAFAGIEGFLANVDTVNGLDDDDAEFGWHLAELADGFGERDFQVDEVLASFRLTLPGVIDPLGKTPGRDLGNLFRKNMGRVYDVDGRQLRLRRAEGHTHGRARWRVQIVGVV